MKTKLYFIVMILSVMGLQACDKDSDDILLSEIPDSIQSFIKEKYPNAQIIEADIKNGITDVDIIDDNFTKELLFGRDGEWISTSWDIVPSAWPVEITNGLKQSAYSDYRMDDVDYFETATGSYYLLELEKGNKEVKVKMDVTGNIIP